MALEHRKVDETASSSSLVAVASVAKSEGTFVQISWKWEIDRTVWPEVRTFITRLYCLAFRQQLEDDEKRKALTYKDFGTGSVSLRTSLEALIGEFGWTKTQLSLVRRVAEAAGYLRLHGSTRTGFVYEVTVALKTYEFGSGPPAPSLFKGKQRAKPTRRQLELRQTLGPGPGLKDATGARSPKSRLSPAAGPKVRVIGSGAGPKNDALGPAAGPESARLGPAPRPKTPRSNVRARTQNTSERNQNNRSAAIPDELLAALALLEQKNDPTVDANSLRFRGTIASIVGQIQKSERVDWDTAIDRLSWVVANYQNLYQPSMTNPIGWLIDHARKGDLLGPTAVKPTRGSAEAAYDTLERALQMDLLQAITDGCASLPWCRARNIPALALDHARKLYARNPHIYADCQEAQL